MQTSGLDCLYVEGASAVHPLSIAKVLFLIIYNENRSVKLLKVKFRDFRIVLFFVIIFWFIRGYARIVFPGDIGWSEV